MKKMFSVNDGTDEQSEWTYGFDFTTTFLHTHSLLNWVYEELRMLDEDEVGLK